MHIVGIIAEYNPFHQGHLSQFAWVKDKLGPDTKIVIALSSYFCQRACPSLQSPRQRARAAVAAGADLVLLLPQYFSNSSGETYAQAGVGLLAASGMVRTQAASAELTDKVLIQEAARLISPESPKLKAAIRDLIGEGLSPHQARTTALLQLGVDPQVVEVFNQANARLCAEYLAARTRLPAGWPHPGFFLCPRQEDSLGASRIRAMVEQAALQSRQKSTWQAPWKHTDSARTSVSPTLLSLELVQGLAAHMPVESLSLLLSDLNRGHFVINSSLLDLAQLSLKRVNQPADLAAYRDMQGGLAERLLSRRDDQDLLGSVTARNFPPGRVQRALTAYLLGIDQSLMRQAGDQPAFLFPLAFNRDGRYILRKMQEKSRIPVFARFSETAKSDDPAVCAQALIERRAAALWAYLAGKPDLAYELLEPPVQV